MVWEGGCPHTLRVYGRCPFYGFGCISIEYAIKSRAGSHRLSPPRGRGDGGKERGNHEGISKRRKGGLHLGRVLRIKEQVSGLSPPLPEFSHPPPPTPRQKNPVQHPLLCPRVAAISFRVSSVYTRALRPAPEFQTRQAELACSTLSFFPTGSQ